MLESSSIHLKSVFFFFERAVQAWNLSPVKFVTRNLTLLQLANVVVSG